MQAQGSCIPVKRGARWFLIGGFLEIRAGVGVCDSPFSRPGYRVNNKQRESKA